MRLAPAAFLVLPRPLNCLIAGLSAYVGAFAVGVRWPTAEVWIAAISAALVLGAGNAFNDVVDLEIDRVNRPARPLPAGRISRRAGRLEALVLALGGAATAWWLGAVNGAIASAALVLLLVYSLWLKVRPGWGNLLIGLLGGAVFLFGAAAAGTWGRAWIPAGFACLFHLGREIIKDMEDVKGDSSRGARTLPLCWGLWRASLLASAIYLVLIAFTFIPWVLGTYGTAYLVPIVGLDLLVLVALYRLHRRREVLADAGLSRLLKVGMLLGLLAIVAGEGL